MSEHGSRRAAPSSRGSRSGGGRRSASSGGFGDKLSGLTGSLSGALSRRGSADDGDSGDRYGDDGYGHGAAYDAREGGSDDVASGGRGSGSRGKGGGGRGPGRGRKPKYDAHNPPPKDWWMRFVDYPRYGKRGWRHWMPSIKQVLSMFLAFVFSVIALVFYAYSAVALPKGGHFIANGSPTKITFDDGKEVVSTVGLPYNEVTIADIPPIVQNAVISAEDKTYFTNPGVSFTGVARSALNNLFGSGGQQGGSTITQQYVKNQFLSPDQTFQRKIQEVMMSIKLTHSENKQQILAGYLNSIAFGRGAIGIDAAATTYFGVHVKQITDPAQAAFLAAMIQSPSSYSVPFEKGSLTPDTLKYSQTSHPVRYETFKRRYNQVLANMKDYGYLTAAVEAPLQGNLPKVNPPQKQKTSGYYGYITDATKDYLAKVHTADPSNPYTNLDTLQQGGYTVVTTFNHQMMDDAIAAANQGLWQSKYDAGWNPAKHPSDKNVNLAFSTVDPRTGYVKAFYTGVDGVENYDVNSFNSALYGGIQVGSTFKAITLATALDTGLYSATSTEPATNSRQLYWPLDCKLDKCKEMYNKNGKLTIWPPNEDDEKPFGGGDATLRQGFEQSLNSVFADLEMEPNVTPKAVYNMAVKLGLDPKSMTIAPSLTLGAAAETPMRMANAYATFANGGTYHDPIMVTKIIKSDTGQVVWTPNITGTRVMTQNTAAGVADIMKGVLTQGTAAGNPVAKTFATQYPNVGGKTGTTDYGYSAWFNGYSSSLATAVGLYRQDPGGSLQSLAGLESGNPTQRINGMSYPTSVWTSFMTIEAKKNPSTFAPPFPTYLNSCTGNASPGATVAAPPSNAVMTPGSSVGANGCLYQFSPTPSPTPTPTTTTVAPPSQPAQFCPYGTDPTNPQVCLPPPTPSTDANTPTGPATDSNTPSTPPSSTTINCKHKPIDPSCPTTTTSSPSPSSPTSTSSPPPSPSTGA